MRIVSPSILSCDFLNLAHELRPFEGERTLWIHLDVMDGHFVPNLSFGMPIIKKLKETTSLPLDVHLMVSNPLFHIESMASLGLHNITFHYEALENPKEAIMLAKKHYKSVGLALKPNTPFGGLSSYLLGDIDLLLIMSVEPGFGGQRFMASSLGQVKMAREHREREGYHYQIQMDGGIDGETAPLASGAGCDNFVAGSYIFEVSSSDYKERVRFLRRCL